VNLTLEKRALTLQTLFNALLRDVHAVIAFSCAEVRC